MAQKSLSRSFPHEMLREIYEQPAAIARTLDYYLDLSESVPKFREEPLAAVAALFRAHPDLIIAASGSSRHAGLAAELLFEDIAGLVVDVEYASEYACRSTTQRRHPDNPSPVLMLSQSGETTDTLAALREAARRGHPTIAVTNVHGSTMAREASVDLATSAGVELAIPATKSFTAQLALINILALLAARERGALTPAEIYRRLKALVRVPEAIESQLPDWERMTAELAQGYSDARTFLYLGRGVHYAIAREGALKLKESSYLHAEGYPTGELKHGPNALVSSKVPLVVIATVDRDDLESVLRYEKTVSLLRDEREQGARVLALANAGDTVILDLATHTIPIKPASEALLPLSEVVPLQLFAYFMAVNHGVDVDRPRNLTKAVIED
jgi:glucosamine--fructose-6-phosphate aminotransferase (isomerizing)